MRYAHTNLIARDFRRLMTFYVDVFGCQLVPPPRSLSGSWLSRGTGVDDAALEGAHLRLPGHGNNGPTLELFTYRKLEEAPPSVANRIGYGHLAFEVDSVKATAEAVLSAGGSMGGEVVDHVVPDAGELTFVYVRDPEGNLIELQSWADQKS